MKFLVKGKYDLTVLGFLLFLKKRGEKIEYMHIAQFAILDIKDNNFYYLLFYLAPLGATALQVQIAQSGQELKCKLPEIICVINTSAMCCRFYRSLPRLRVI